MHLDLFYIPVSWVLLRWHQLLDTLGLNPNSGVTWALAIVLLVVTARLLLLPMFVKQVAYQRNMERLAPKLKRLREKYQDDRAELNRRIVQLQQQEGFSPLAGFLPLLLQIPVFLGLYHVLRHLSNSTALCPGAGNGLLHLYTFTSAQTCSAAQAKLFGAPLAASFRSSAQHVSLLGGDVAATRIVILLLLVISAAATVATTLRARANTTVAPEGPAVMVQRIMLFLIPLGLLAGGLLFPVPLGVVLYWLTSNLWTLAQQAYIIRFHPARIAQPLPPTDGREANAATR
jgi:YidC/Oxa1 family membrane protein insertase